MLLSNLNLLATALGGVVKLRELILALAVQGKLVPQDPADETARVLLQKIRAEKDRLIAEGQIRRDKSLAAIADEEKPFELPEGWEWVRLAELAYPQAGFAFRSNGFNEAGLGLPLIRIRDVGDNDPATFFSGEFRPEFVVQPGDWLISMDGEFRVREWRGPDALLNQRVTRLIFFGDELSQPFVSIALQFRLRELQGTKAYTTVDHLSGGQIAAALIPLPPLPEQSRIVTRVEELMRLCDALEAKGQLEATQHAQLVSTLLGTLTASATSEELADHWLRVAQNFDLLLDRPEAIDALELTIFGLALRGVLTSREPADVPALEVLKRVAERRKKTRANSNSNNAGPTAENPFALPPSWAWCTVEEVATVCLGGTPARQEPSYWNGSIPWVSSGEVANGRISETKEKITAAGLAHSNAKVYPKNTVLVAMIGQGKTRGQSAILDIEACTNQNVAGLVLEQDAANPDYIFLWALHEYVRTRSGGRGGAQPALNGAIIRSLRLPLPPLAEQSRIVSRVATLRRLCADLRQRLVASQTTQSHLAQALVESATSI